VHTASYEKMRAFRSAYLPEENRPTTLRVLDVGSSSKPTARNYRWLFAPPTFEYVGLDVEEGHNVDVVPGDPFCWSELADESFDIVVSGQMLEHNPFFWITLAEIARVARPGGLVALIAPSEGRVHRYPLDCWRFYPDSWAAMCTYVGLDLVETYRERPSWRKTIPGVIWGDAMMVARKPNLADGEKRAGFYCRLAAIASTRPSPEVVAVGEGPAAAVYEHTHTLRAVQVAWRPDQLGHLVARAWSEVRYHRWTIEALLRLRRADARGALARGERTMGSESEPPPT
jgi:SAM-dependent methyltransferase